jgi:tetratricopeptide (TPR) repeat protein
MPQMGTPAGRRLSDGAMKTVLVPSLCAALALGACATGGTQAPPANPATPAVHYDMEPIAIEAKGGGAGVQIESFDAEELFEQAGAALSQKRYDDAVRLYDKLLASFPESSFARPGMYNRGLAFRDKKDWNAAVEAFKGLVDKYASHADAKDGLFQLGACYAELTNWPASGQVFVRLLERQDLTADDRIEAMARRGFAQFNLGDLDAAEKTFRGVFSYKQHIENEERLATDFYLAFSQYHLGQINHQRFRAVALRLPESQMDRDLDQKASLLLQAQRAYIDTIKFGNPAWASAAGFQVGSLYEELYDSFMNAPVPRELKGEARDVYLAELHKKIRVLLEKSVKWYRENLLMIERLGVNTDWAEKSKLAYAKLVRLLDPKTSPEELTPTAPHRDQAPPAPKPPVRPTPENPSDTPPTNEAAPQRQIL